ncbi:MAG: helicase-related protein, partial [Pseudomonadota bacterium]
TYSNEIKQLADGLLDNPALVEVARRNTTAETVNQTVHFVNRGRKRELLSHLINLGDWQQVLVFTRTKHGANRLAEQLIRDDISAAAIHGNKSQGARTQALANFKAGKVRVLVATDIAARGLDIDRLPHVVNYELPNVPEDYVHRIGRTGRAGEEGDALSLVCSEEFKFLRDIERLLKRELPRISVPGFEFSEKAMPPPAQPAQQRKKPKPNGNNQQVRSQRRSENGRKANEQTRRRPQRAKPSGNKAKGKGPWANSRSAG